MDERRSPGTGRDAATAAAPPSPLRRRVLLGFLAVWLAVQVLVPLRHLLYPGSPSWTEEGHMFAWRMKLRDKKANAVFFVKDPATGREWPVWPGTYLLPHQTRKMITRPDMIVQFAHHLAGIQRDEYNLPEVEVRAHVCVSLNGREGALLIDPRRDLLRETRSLGHADWVLPLDEPFARPPRREGRRPDDIRC